MAGLLDAGFGVLAPPKGPSVDTLGVSKPTRTTEETPVEHQQQYVGIDLHRRRSVIVRMTDDRRGALDGADRQRPDGVGAWRSPRPALIRRWRLESTLWLVLGGRSAPSGRGPGASGAPVGFALGHPSGQERRPGCHRAGDGDVPLGPRAPSVSRCEPSSERSAVTTPRAAQSIQPKQIASSSAAS